MKQLGVGGLQEWSSALMACLPAAERARARLQMELARMRARARSIGWSQIALAASLAIMVRAKVSQADLAGWRGYGENCVLTSLAWDRK